MYAQACLEDTVGKIELIAFPQSWGEKLAGGIKIDVPVLIRASARRRRFGSRWQSTASRRLRDVKAEAAGVVADKDSPCMLRTR